MFPSQMYFSILRYGLDGVDHKLTVQSYAYLSSNLVSSWLELSLFSNLGELCKHSAGLPRT